MISKKMREHESVYTTVHSRLQPSEDTALKMYMLGRLIGSKSRQVSPRNEKYSQTVASEFMKSKKKNQTDLHSINQKDKRNET